MNRFRLLNVLIMLVLAVVTAGPAGGEGDDYIPFFLVASLHPPFLDSDCVSDDAFLGTWRSSDSTTVLIESGEGNSYRVSSEDGPYIGHFFKLEGRLFLDLRADVKATALDDGLAHTLASLRFLFRVEQSEDQQRWRFLSHETVDTALAADPSMVAHTRMKTMDILLITAETEDLRAFLQEHLVVEGWFGEDAMDLQRIGGSSGRDR